MATEEYLKIGRHINIDGVDYYSPDCYDEGCFFKDEEAFKKNPDAICYIPEAYFDGDIDVWIDGLPFYKVKGYTRKDIEEITKAYVDDEDEPLDPEFVFQELEWSCVETFLNEYNYVG